MVEFKRIDVRIAFRRGDPILDFFDRVLGQLPRLVFGGLAFRQGCRVRGPRTGDFPGQVDKGGVAVGGLHGAQLQPVGVVDRIIAGLRHGKKVAHDAGCPLPLLRRRGRCLARISSPRSSAVRRTSAAVCSRSASPA